MCCYLPKIAANIVQTWSKQLSVIYDWFCQIPLCDWITVLISAHHGIVLPPSDNWFKYVMVSCHDNLNGFIAVNGNFVNIKCYIILFFHFFNMNLSNNNSFYMSGHVLPPTDNCCMLSAQTTGLGFVRCRTFWCRNIDQCRSINIRYKIILGYIYKDKMIYKIVLFSDVTSKMVINPPNTSEDPDSR